MPAAMAWWAAGGVAVVALCIGVGDAAGNDAVRQIDRFYTAPPTRAPRAPPMPVSSPADWDTAPAEAAVPFDPSEVVAGDARSGGSDLMEIDRAVERAAAVRVHRGRQADADPAPGAQPRPTT